MIRTTASYFSIGSLAIFVGLPMLWMELDGRARLAAILPPPEWAAHATPEDRLEVPGYEIAYWADPNARYSVTGSKRKNKPVAIVVHYTTVQPVLEVVDYGHRPDFSRGGHVYGYHFYLGRGGGIAQGAPLTMRTNHIKSSHHPQRRPTASHLWSGNTIGISLIGGCDPLLRPNWRRWGRCGGEYITPAQLRAGLALVHAIQKRFGIACDQVYGHGDLQTDRASYEGATLTRLSRATCANAADH